MKNQAKIIVVDDEQGICENVEKILLKSNYAVVHTQSAEEALDMMKKESFELLISDIVMPEMNGLELLKHVAKEIPDVKTIMMTGYASTNTAMKAIRLGALDYIPKPFTPDELRTTVSKALSGELMKVESSEEEKNAIEIMDVEIDFGTDAAPNLTKAEPEIAVEESSDKDNEFYCTVGERICDVKKKLGATCKTGLTKNYCPKRKAEERKKAKAAANNAFVFNPKTMIGIDQPFDYNEVIAVTGPEYVQYMDRDGFAFLPYEDLKKINRAKVMGESDNDMVTDTAEKLLQKNILVVDDEVSVNNNIRKILVKNGFNVDQAMTKDETVEKINNRPYTLVLLDLRMPGVSGFDLLKEISSAQPSARVIIITGYASIETAIETARIGAVDYLHKPFTPDELRNVAEKAYAIAA